MSAPTQPTVVIGVTGCVAIYKTCEIIRLLQKRGVRAKVIMTEHARGFIDPTMFRSLTREPVAVGLFDDPSDPIHHISLAKEADVFAIAPCTVNVIAKIACGIADDLLTTTALATTAPIVIAPAANVNMYEAPVSRENRDRLRARGVRLVEAESGYLACGDEGRGRMADPTDIVEAICSELGISRDLAGKKVLVTAGPTVEPIDPVRYLSNRSSGKMGFEVAKAAARRGAEVFLVTGPVSLADPAGVETVRVETAREMLAAVEGRFDEADIAVFAAAVADMRPAAPASGKLKKGSDSDALARIELVENPDILATMARRKSKQVVVGFAAETDDVVENARKKLRAKGADYVVANFVGEGGAFDADDNEVVVVSAEGERPYPRSSKSAVADALFDHILSTC
ncbi:MAG: bifunctional phosphopantothenoylcysteine decarboxylase/phosphopantothenate--cysteine ligase CoaBC [Berryella intestinalis]|uniref:bifunctional phosphopantothenoylcysteine decarboxylase/phosphopantothenate--cysteine ligase CoaBC n=1 Tax=Berryella intestinalis TaxID=1531429 RepID=UPI002A759C23|nr:bifunctional phosphopantothenoylcysteine decarboxylase/phosphopantothenate--cysteine ligase CoaBC [Berryella intestinalis]MDY3129859.1 bifunctional phosphopantothenoylcysteine decarboxylase/phosphopantothenate--cysteine ligase CoaBC [Berryella intestinalis]